MNEPALLKEDPEAYFNRVRRAKLTDGAFLQYWLLYNRRADLNRQIAGLLRQVQALEHCRAKLNQEMAEWKPKVKPENLTLL